MEELDKKLNLVEDASTSYNANKDFTTLDCWKNAREVKLFFYSKVLSKLPKEETYQLGSQIRNASISIQRILLKVMADFIIQEGIQFYRIARGSLYELKDQLISCYDLNYIEKSLVIEGLTLIEDAKKKLNGYIKYVKKQKKNS